MTRIDCRPLRAIGFVLALAVVTLCAASLHSQSVLPPSPSRITLWVVGDSTANNKWSGGWGQSLQSFLIPEEVYVENRAKAGSSSRTFYRDQLWSDVSLHLHRGDWVLIAFGHNDGGPPGAPKYRGSLPGIAADTQDVGMEDHSVETVHSYGWYVRRMVEDSKKKGAHPVLVGVTVRNIWTAGNIERKMGSFNEWDKKISEEEHIPFLDLTNLIANKFEAIGQDGVAGFFPNDHTHNNPQGGEKNAEGVIACLKRLHDWHNKKLYSPAGRQIHVASRKYVSH